MTRRRWHLDRQYIPRTTSDQAETLARALLDAHRRLERLRESVNELRLWEPGRKGYAAALDRALAVAASDPDKGDACPPAARRNDDRAACTPPGGPPFF